MHTRKQLSRESVIRFVLLGGLSLFAVVGYLRLNASAAAMRAATEEVTECKRLVAEISELRQLPQFAALEPDSPQVTGERIEEARKQARLPVASLVRIQPMSPYRLGSSEYRLWPTRLELNGVTLQQLTTFSHALTDEVRGLTVRDLRIWTTSGAGNAGAAETWAVEIALTQVTFFPTSRR